MLSCLPQLTDFEFDEGCEDLLRRFHQYGHAQQEWLSVELIEAHGAKHLRITKEIQPRSCAPAHCASDTDRDEVDQYDNYDDADDDDDDDNEVIDHALKSKSTIVYDIILSPTYCIPVLYISIADPQHRFPLSLTTLYEHLVPPQYKPQVEVAGVMGGITFAHHPVSGRPVFFVHPCQTAEVMSVIVGTKNITAEEYLIAWMGALTKCAGLTVPLALVRQDGDS